MSIEGLEVETKRGRITARIGSMVKQPGLGLRKPGLAIKQRPSLDGRRKGRFGVIVALLSALVLLISQMPVIFAQGESANTARGFERHDPVYTQVLVAGSADELKLPSTLRAVFPLPEGMDTELFVQAQPVADMSDGYEHFDYYWFGYVAPKGAKQMYADGDKVIYSIYYAKQDENGQALSDVGETAYRLYGSIADSGAIWFSCDEAGAINGIIREVPVTWEGRGYDPSSPGEYLFTAKTSAYKLGCANPVAKITVTAAKQDSCGAEGHVGCEHEDAQAITSEGDAHCSCSVNKNVASSAHAKNCPCYQPECSCVLQKDQPAAEGESHAEGCYWYPQGSEADDDGFVGDGMHQEGGSLSPVAPAIGCHCAPDGGPIDADNLPWAHLEGCQHFSPMECMCREMVEVQSIDPQTGETIALTVPGKLDHNHDPGNADCPLYGKDTVDIIKLQTGERSVMAEAEAQNAAALAEGLLYPALGRIEIVAGSDKNGIDYDPGMRLLSINGGGANDLSGDSIMTQATPTTGNSVGSGTYDSGVSGIWRDYINTIWMNKAYTRFAWTPASATGAYKGWAWGGTVATGGKGTVDTEPLCQPQAVNGVYTVYSGEQLRSALLQAKATDPGIKIVLGGNINLNGSEQNWGTIDLGSSMRLTLLGENKTLYNLGITSPLSTSGSGRQGWFIGRWLGYDQTAKDVEGAFVNISNLTFATPKIVTPYARTGMFCRLGHKSEISNVSIKAGLFYGGLDGAEDGWGASPFGNLISKFRQAASGYKNLTQLYSQDCYIYSRDHAAGLALQIYRCTLSNSYAVGNLICSTGGHSGGFVSCSASGITIQNCFSAAEIYGSKEVYGFGTHSNVSYKDCYATGKLEGYENLKGFAMMTSNTSESATPKKYCTNCYSTVLVGLRSESKILDGFGQGGKGTETTPLSSFDSCYAAGEVGNTNTNMSNPVNAGGFLSTTPIKEANNTFKNCYYDKQATAMREWVAGDNKTVTGSTGIVGVLTSTTTKAGTGLASGSNGSGASKGFRGFTDNSKWVFTPEHYPQLAVFANASTANWLTAERADLVKAYSLASTATVFLNTWDTGYDWDNNGVRSANQLSYNRTLASTGKTNHKGHAESYDTVREIVSDAPVTSTANWEHMIPGGAPADWDNNGQADGHAMDISGSGGIVIQGPGMDWFKISETVNGQTGYRPIRLISYMRLDAGSDRLLTAGTSYNHRSDVSLTMMDKVTDNRVVGLHDSQIWSTSKTGGYPGGSKFWALPTPQLEGSYTASKDAWLYTEIWSAKQNADGSFVVDAVNGVGSEHLVLDKSVKVTGTGTGSGTTLTEKLWNGEIPMFEDTSVERKYLISYYWMLSDGRYRSDTKTVTIAPGKYKLSIDVKNDADNSPAPNKLFLGTAVDAGANTGYAYSPTTLGHAETADIAYTQNAAAAWKKGSGSTSITKAELQLAAQDGTVVGTAALNGELAVGKSFTIPVKLHYNTVAWDAAQNANRESVMESGTVNLTYTVEQDANGGLFLRFNKLLNPPAYELTAATQHGSSAGIPAGTLGYINEMRYNIRLTIWVTGSNDPDFEFIKTDKDGKPLAGAEFELYACKQAGSSGHTHSPVASTAPGNCWNLASPVDAQASGADGKLVFAALPSGSYMLVETKTLPGLQLPTGQWLLEVNAAAGSIDITAKGSDLPPAFKTVASGGGYRLELPNYPVMTLPRAGGAGALWFTVGGASLLAAAVLLLFFHRRRPALAQPDGAGPAGPGTARRRPGGGPGGEPRTRPGRGPGRRRPGGEPGRKPGGEPGRKPRQSLDHLML